MKVTIEQLEAYLRDRYISSATEQSMFMKLAEEVGEVAEVLNKRCGRKASDGSDLKEQLGSELADVIHYAFAIAAINDIDLNSVIISKDEKASVKYGHDINLTEFIRSRYMSDKPEIR